MKVRSSKGTFQRVILDRPCAHCSMPFHPSEERIKCCSRPCAAALRKGKRNAGNYKAARTLVQGYVFVRDTEKGKAVQEHRLVMEAHLGRKLFPEEVVHHINRNRSDNRLENLQLCANNGEHLQLHGVESTSDCFECGVVDRLTKRMCKACYQRHRRAVKRAVSLVETQPITR